jgi:uncharacterized protein with FMN-binding domain
MKRPLTRLRIVFAAALAAALAAGFVTALAGCKGSPDPIVLSMPELAQIGDGVYAGEAKKFPVLARVEVTVDGGRITTFEILKHRNGRGRAAEALAGRVVEAQTIEIDAVSGATYSSMVILKAGENALRSGLAP